MKLSDLMTPNPISVDMDDKLSRVKTVFDEIGFHHLLVTEQGRLFGIITDRDLLKALSPRIGTAAETTKDLASLNKRAHQIMARKPITLKPNATVFDAIKALNNHKISCIPVIDDEEKPVGILSWRDVMRALAEARPD